MNVRTIAAIGKNAAQYRRTALIRTIVACASCEAFFIARPYVKPVLQAMVLADHVYVDQATNKRIIAGTFNTLKKVKAAISQQSGSEEGGSGKKLLTMPQSGFAGSPFLYLNLVDVHGKVALVLEFIDLSTNRALMTAEITVSSNDPLNPLETHLALPPLPTPKAGVYALSLFWQDEILGSLRVVAKDEREVQNNE